MSSWPKMGFPSNFLWAGTMSDFFDWFRFCHRRLKTHAIAISVVSLESMVPSEVWTLILSKMPPGGPPPKVPLLGTRPCPDHPKMLVYGGISRVHFRASRLSESRNCFAERLHWCTAIRTSLESTGGRILERPVAIFKIPGNPAGQPAGAWPQGLRVQGPRRQAGPNRSLAGRPACVRASVGAWAAPPDRWLADRLAGQPVPGWPTAWPKVPGGRRGPNQMLAAAGGCQPAGAPRCWGSKVPGGRRHDIEMRFIRVPWVRVPRDSLSHRTHRTRIRQSWGTLNPKPLILLVLSSKINDFTKKH